jgi:aryl sulfotransferase
VTQSWWDWRHLPNLVTLHYSDLKHDLASNVRRIAAFLEIALTEEHLAKVVASTTFEAMKARGADYVPNAGASWRGGADTFLHSGVSGRWRDVLSAEDLALYDAACDRVLSTDCRRWLEAAE